MGKIVSHIIKQMFSYPSEVLKSFSKNNVTEAHIVDTKEAHNIEPVAAGFY